MRVEIHVRPNASSTSVGGTYDGLLVVKVREPADAGRATAGALAAVAAALDVPRRSVTLVRGATSRRRMLKIDVAGTDAAPVRRTLQGLRGEPSG